MNKNLKDESGMTLVESLMAIVILLIGLLAMAQVMAFCVVASKNYGRDAGKTTVIARDKMEELSSLPFLSLTAGGSVDPAAPTTGYVEYFNLAGGTTTQAAAAYTRQWQVISDSATVRRIIVLVTSNKSIKYGVAPSTTMVTVKTP